MSATVEPVPPPILEEKPTSEEPQSTQQIPKAQDDPFLTKTLDDDDTTAGIRKLPFARVSASTQVPPPPELSTEQTTKYNSLHNTVSSWTTIPTSASPKAPHSPITEKEQIWLTRECLLRYLRATSWNVQNAMNRVQGTLVWRREYGLERLTPDYISIENETGKQWILGYDNAGRPCHYLNPSRQNTERSDRQIEHLVFMLERSLDLTPPGQETLALLINFAETSKGQGATISQGKQTLNILQYHYPERLGRALCCNIPWHIWAFLKLITPFIDPQTRQKIIYNQDMRQHVPPEHLKKSHGGDLEFEYEHSTYWPALNKLAQERREAQWERWVKGGKRIGEFEMYLKGGQEQCLRDTMRTSSDDMTEKMGDVQVTDKLVKTVAIVEDGKKDEPVNGQAAVNA